jgi:hypothetical protein
MEDGHLVPSTLDEELQRMKESGEKSCVCIKVQWVKEKSESLLWYVKLRKHRKELYQRENVCCCFGSFPYISTAHQFFDEELFDAFVQKGSVLSFFLSLLMLILFFSFLFRSKRCPSCGGGHQVPSSSHPCAQ